MPDEVTIECLQRSPYSIELTHDVWCAALGHCDCETRKRTVSVHDPVSGKTSFRTDEFRAPRMLRIMPGRANAVKAQGAVLDCPGVRRALSRQPKSPPRLRLR
jgi:hypothetical protein